MLETENINLAIKRIGVLENEDGSDLNGSGN